MTGFTITDAEDLEDEEAPISAELTGRIGTYGPLTTLQRLFGKDSGFEGKDCEYDVLC